MFIMMQQQFEKLLWMFWYFKLVCLTWWSVTNTVCPAYTKWKWSLQCFHGVCHSPTASFHEVFTSRLNFQPTLQRTLITKLLQNSLATFMVVCCSCRFDNFIKQLLFMVATVFFCVKSQRCHNLSPVPHHSVFIHVLITFYMARSINAFASGTMHLSIQLHASGVGVPVC